MADLLKLWCFTNWSKCNLHTTDFVKQQMMHCLSILIIVPKCSMKSKISINFVIKN